MGRRLFQEVYASQDRTDALGLPDLMVVSEADDPETADSIYHAVHKTYFSKNKSVLTARVQTRRKQKSVPGSSRISSPPRTVIEK